MSRMLLLGAGGSDLSQMALALARRLAPGEVSISNADLAPGPVHPNAEAALVEHGITFFDGDSPSLGQLDVSTYDLVVALNREAAAHCVLLPGSPVVLRWDIPNPQGHTQPHSIEAYREVRDELQRRLEDFFLGGYLATMLALKGHGEIVLDHLSDGIIVHDTNRVIRYFNRAAERITGFSRHDVIGHDCWEVFSGGFCGDLCHTKNAPHLHPDQVDYPLKVIAKNGREKRVEMSCIAMHNQEGACQGMLASFRDITEVTNLREQLKTARSFHGIIGASEQMHEVYEVIRDLAASDCTVLVQGESGAGKELVANAIHGEGARASRPFVTVNCGALPEGILESELFGHVRGAFTGAVRDKKGRFELAHTGTIFLDEVAELSPTMQVKLLHVLQKGIIERVGDEKQIRIDVRVISATNRDLRQMVAEGSFREDLYYRLCVVPVTLPPLRERRNDIPLLVTHFMERLSAESGRKIHEIDPEALHEMIDYAWPGNVRELQNAIQYAFVKCKGRTLRANHLPPEIVSYSARRGPARFRRRGKLEPISVQAALEQADGNKVKAAQMLGVGRATLYRFLADHPVEPGLRRRPRTHS